jgi:hypothetical protein
VQRPGWLSGLPIHLNKGYWQSVPPRINHLALVLNTCLHLVSTFRFISTRPIWLHNVHRACVFLQSCTLLPTNLSQTTDANTIHKSVIPSCTQKCTTNRVPERHICHGSPISYKGYIRREIRAPCCCFYHFGGAHKETVGQLQCQSWAPSVFITDRTSEPVTFGVRDFTVAFMYRNSRKYFMLFTYIYIYICF